MNRPNIRKKPILSGLMLTALLTTGTGISHAENGKIVISGITDSKISAGETIENVSISITPPADASDFKYSAFNFTINCTEGLTISNVALGSLQGSNIWTNSVGDQQTKVIWFGEMEGATTKEHNQLNNIVTFTVKAGATKETNKNQTISVTDIVFSDQKGNELTFEPSSEFPVTIDFGEMTDNSVTIKPGQREEEDDPTLTDSEKRTYNEIYIDETFTYSVKLDESIIINDLKWSIAEGSPSVSIEEMGDHSVKVTGKAFGKSKLKVSSEYYNYSKELEVTVIPMPVKTVTISVPQGVNIGQLHVGDPNVNLSVAVTPAEKYTGPVTFNWTSSSTGNAIVTASNPTTSASLEAKKIGDATVSATVVYVNETARSRYTTVKKGDLSVKIVPVTEDKVKITFPNVDFADGFVQIIVGEEKTFNIDVQPGQDAMGEYTVTWLSSDSGFVSVNNSGKIKAEQYTDTEITITATVKYDTDKEVSAVIKVKVLPKEATSLTLTSISLEDFTLLAEGYEFDVVTAKTELKTTEWINLTAIVDEEATFKNIVWSVEPADAVEFDYVNYLDGKTQYSDNDDRHNVTVKIKEGTTASSAVITAKVEKTPAVSATYSINISPVNLGDANDNGNINSSDVITVRNEILRETGNKSINDNFSFVNADIKVDKSIDVNDMNAIINLVIGLPAFPDQASGSSQMSALKLPSLNDKLIIDNFRVFGNNETEINVKLQNASAYISLQADVRIPEGMEIIEIEAGASAISHTLVYKQISEDLWRVLIYSMKNDTFNENEDPLFTIKAKAAADCGDITIERIITSDKFINKYELESEGGKNNRSADVEINVSELKVIVGYCDITILNGAGKEFSVYSIDGKQVNSFTATTDEEIVRLPKGIYVLTTEHDSFKVNIRN